MGIRIFSLLFPLSSGRRGARGRRRKPDPLPFLFSWVVVEWMGFPLDISFLFPSRQLQGVDAPLFPLFFPSSQPESIGAPFPSGLIGADVDQIPFFPPLLFVHGASGFRSRGARGSLFPFLTTGHRRAWFCAFPPSFPPPREKIQPRQRTGPMFSPLLSPNVSFPSSATLPFSSLMGISALLPFFFFFSWLQKESSLSPF